MDKSDNDLRNRSGNSRMLVDLIRLIPIPKERVNNKKGFNNKGQRREARKYSKLFLLVNGINIKCVKISTRFK